MEYRTLGRTGLKVSAIGHGLWGMGSWKDSNDDESRRALQLSLDLGCAFFDSAWVYGFGKSDALLGELIHKNATKRIVAASKVPPKNMQWPASSEHAIEDAYPVDHVLEYAEKILSTMGVTKIDLLQFHVWDDSWAESPVWRESVERLKEQGKIAAFGISLNKREAANGIRAVRTGLIDVVQVVYNIFEQAPEDALFPACQEQGVGVIARVPLDEGALGGKLTMESRFPPDDYRAKYFAPDKLAETVPRVEALKKIVPEGMSLPEMSMRFALGHPAVGTVIVGMRKEEHVRQNLAFDAAPLDAGLIARLRAHRWDRQP
jgi:aryl-alcohol dehydrogenase-like predicted oxidoreductase